MADKPQQQTLSVRISEALRQRLERARQLVVSKSGEGVSTSDIAKQLLESAREDRLEVVDLMAEPTKVLIEIRRKGEADHLLSKPELTVLAYFVQQGLEAFSKDTPTPVSRESMIAALDAFLAVYELRKGASTWDEYYLGNLPTDCQPGKSRSTGQTETVTADIVRRTVMETRRRTSDPSSKYNPLLAGRNLYVLLENERLSGAAALNRALRPFWPALWRLAARGHYYAYQRPIREKLHVSEEMYKPPIPPISEGGFTLSFARGEGNDFAVLLSFPGPRAPQYPLDGFPKITEFRRMLAALGPQSTAEHWKGEYFFGFRAERQNEIDFAFRARGNGITFTLTEGEWKAVQELFRHGWENPEVRLAWNGLILEYGEL